MGCGASSLPAQAQDKYKDEGAPKSSPHFVSSSRQLPSYPSQTGEHHVPAAPREHGPSAAGAAQVSHNGGSVHSLDTMGLI